MTEPQLYLSSLFVVGAWAAEERPHRAALLRETLLLVVPGGEGAGGKEEEGAVHTRAGAQAHRARPAGLSVVLFVKEEEEEEEGEKKAAQV